MVIHSVGMLAYRGEDIILVKHTEAAKLPTGHYGFPAGRIEPDEASIDAAIREFNEETGLETTRHHVFSLPEFNESKIMLKSGEEDFTVRPFLCRNYWGEFSPSEDNVPEYVPVSKLSEILVVSPDIQPLSEKYHGWDQVMVQDVAERLCRGIDPEEFMALENLMIMDGELTAGQYLERLVDIKIARETQGAYTLRRRHIGALRMRGVPSHFVDVSSQY